MASNSGRRSGSSGHSTPRKRVVIGADETVRVRYDKNQPTVESERRSTPRQNARAATTRAGVRQRPSSGAGKQLSRAKREEREQRQRAIRARRAAVGAAIAVVVGLLAWGVVSLYQAPLFRVQKIVVTGVSHLDRAAVLKLAAIPDDATLPRINPRKISAAIEADPWVAAVRVDRDFPRTVRLEVTERRPVAVVDAGGTQLWVVSTDGYWLGRRSGEESGVVVVRDIERLAPKAGTKARSPELTNAVRIIAGLSDELRAQTRLVSAPGIEKTALITDDDVEIFFGEATQIAKKDRIAREILKSEKGKVVYINVRVVESPTWRGLNE